MKGNYTLHGYAGTKVYVVWKGIKQRCTNPKHKDYKTYKGRLCDEWYEPVPFITWALSNGYKEGLSIDRIDNSKGYFPDNCRFITVSENTIKSNQERDVNLYSFNGATYTERQLIKILNTTRGKIRGCIRKGTYPRIK